MHKVFTVILAAPIDVVRRHCQEHLPGAKLRYSEAKAMTAIQHPSLTELGPDGVRDICFAQQLPLVRCVHISAFADGEARTS